MEQDQNQGTDARPIVCGAEVTTAATDEIAETSLVAVVALRSIEDQPPTSRISYTTFASHAHCKTQRSFSIPRPHIL